MTNIQGVYLFVFGLLIGGASVGPVDRFLKRHQPPKTSGAVAITNRADGPAVDFCYLMTLHDDPPANNPLGPSTPYETLVGHDGSFAGRHISTYDQTADHRRLTHDELVAYAAKIGCLLQPEPH